MIQFSSSSQPHFSAKHGTWSNCTFSYSNMYRSHYYLFAHTAPTFWSTSSLSLYLVNFHVFFKVPTQISFLQEDSPTSKAGFRSPPFVLPPSLYLSNQSVYHIMLSMTLTCLSPGLDCKLFEGRAHICHSHTCMYVYESCLNFWKFHYTYQWSFHYLGFSVLLHSSPVICAPPYSSH